MSPRTAKKLAEEVLRVSLSPAHLVPPGTFERVCADNAWKLAKVVELLLPLATPEALEKLRRMR